MPRRFSTPTALRWNFRKRRVGTSRSSPRSTGHGPDRGAGRGPKGQAQGEKAVVERGEDFARARQGKSHAGLRRRAGRRRGGGGAAPFRLRGSGALRGGFARARGRGPEGGSIF